MGNQHKTLYWEHKLNLSEYSEFWVTNYDFPSAEVNKFCIIVRKNLILELD